MEHKLKIKKEYLNNLLEKKKTCEIRYNDRDFQVGDEVFVFESDGVNTAKGATASYKISHIHSGLGLQDNYVILSFKKLIIEV